MRNKGLLAIAALGVALAIGVFAAGCTGGSPGPAASTNDEANPPKSNPETGAFRKVAFKACMNSAANERVPADRAEAYCACAVDGLVKNANVEEMARIGLSGEEDLPTDVEMELMDAIVPCSNISNLTDY